MEKIYSEFIDYIQYYLLDQKITVTKFAKRINVTKRCVVSWLQGKSFPSTECVVRVADFFNISVDYLCNCSEQANYVPATRRVRVAERLRILYKTSAYKKSQLALLWGISSSLLTKWFAGKRLPQLHSIFIIADCFGCSMDYLLGRTDLR